MEFYIVLRYKLWLDDESVKLFGLYIVEEVERIHQTRFEQRQRLRSGIWTRRRIHWRRRGISRTVFIIEAVEVFIKQRIYRQLKSQERNEQMVTKPCSDILKRKSHAGTGSQLDAELQDMNEVMQHKIKTWCSSSKRKTIKQARTYFQENVFVCRVHSL